MIENETQLHVTLEQVEKFRTALAGLPVSGTELQMAEREGVQSLLADLEAEVAEYEARQRRVD